VLGLDVDEAKIREIEAGRSYIRHIPAEDVAAQVKAGRFVASSDFSLVKESEAVVICVPTPLNKNREPDISYILKTGEAIAPYLRTEGGGRRAGEEKN
jgi:UDP-N-acetyl-D-glucosamine dehydrogenase